MAGSHALLTIRNLKMDTDHASNRAVRASRLASFSALLAVTVGVMALADVFDALISPRVYKPAMPYQQVREIIAAGRGQHFDPDLTDECLADFADFVAIAESHRDGTGHPLLEQAIPTGREA